MSKTIEVHERVKIQIFEIDEITSLPVGIEFGVPALVVAESRPAWFSLLRVGRSWLKPAQFAQPELREFAERSALLGFSLEGESLQVEENRVGTDVRALVPGGPGYTHQSFGAGDTTVGLADPDQPKLSQREMEVLQLLSEGWSNQEIGRFSKLSLGTVKFHLAHIFEKLGAANRAEAVRRAAESGLLQF